jgi:hypothetical protein
MRSVARVIAIIGLIALTVSAGNVSAQEFDQFIGTWILNVSKSEWGTAKPPQSQIRTFDYTHDGRIICTWRNVSASGTRGFVHWFSKLDGQHNPEFSRGRREATSTIAIKKIDNSSITIEGKRLSDGRVTFSGTASASKDGKTLTWRIKDIDDQGKENVSVRIYEKEEAKTSTSS